MKISSEALRFYLNKTVPRKPLSVIAKETGIDVEKLEKALKKPVNFSYEELEKLGAVLGTSSYFLIEPPCKLEADADRFDFRQLARTKKGKVVWFEIFPESRNCGVIDTPHTGLHYLKDPLSPVLQCTGLKDSKGVPVWEGDVIVRRNPTRVLEVKWSEEEYRFIVTDGKDTAPLSAIARSNYSFNVIGNVYIAPIGVYGKLWEAFPENLEIDDSTLLRTVIYTGVSRPDGDDVVLYLERDFNEDRLYLTDLGETAMFIASCGIEPGFEEVKREVNEENVVEKAREMIEEITLRFRQSVKHMRFGGRKYEDGKN